MAGHARLYCLLKFLQMILKCAEKPINDISMKEIYAKATMIFTSLDVVILSRFTILKMIGRPTLALKRWLDFKSWRGSVEKSMRKKYMYR